MYQGKHKCETLKAIRKKIADANEIPYEPVKCTHEGDCAGTCPACESEMRYIENQLNVRKLAGKAVKIVGLASAMTLAACDSDIPETPFVPVEEEVCDDCNELFDDIEHAKCTKDVLNYLYNVRYPISAVDAGVTGTVVVSFVVEADGSISNVESKKSVYPDLTNEAIRVVQNMEKWTPAMCNGKPVRSKFHVPIQFYYDTPGFYLPPKTFDHCKINIPDEENLYFVRVEKHAEFPEGKKALYDYLRQNLDKLKSGVDSENLLHYEWWEDFYRDSVWTGSRQREKRDNNTIYDEYDNIIDEGNFLENRVMFVVEKDGSLSNIESWNCSLNEEAIRVVKKMPKWKPATIRDTVVRSKFFLPVLFKIDENEDK